VNFLLSNRMGSLCSHRLYGGRSFGCSYSIPGFALRCIFHTVAPEIKRKMQIRNARRSLRPPRPRASYPKRSGVLGRRSEFDRRRLGQSSCNSKLSTAVHASVCGRNFQPPHQVLSLSGEARARLNPCGALPRLVVHTQCGYHLQIHACKEIAAP
jgi:hypothetical protein